MWREGDKDERGEERQRKCGSRENGKTSKGVKAVERKALSGAANRFVAFVFARGLIGWQIVRLRH